MLVLPVVLVEMPETRDDVAALPAKVADIMQPLVDKILTALVNDSEASGFIKDIDVDSAQPIQVLPGILYESFLEKIKKVISEQVQHKPSYTSTKDG